METVEDDRDHDRVSFYHRLIFMRPVPPEFSLTSVRLKIMLSDIDMAILETLDDTRRLQPDDKRHMTQAAIRTKVKGKQVTLDAALHDLSRRGLIARKMRGVKPVGWLITGAGLRSLAYAHFRFWNVERRPAP
jgi:hypothetical protein